MSFMAFVAFMIGRKKYVKILLPDEVSTPLHYFSMSSEPIAAFFCLGKIYGCQRGGNHDVIGSL